MRRITRIALFFAMVIISAHTFSQQDQEPIKNPPFIENHQQADSQEKQGEKEAQAYKNPASALPINEIKTPTDKLSPKEYEQRNAVNRPRSWGDVFKDPTSVFTGILALFTIFLVIAGAAQLAIARDTEKRQLRAYVFLEAISIGNVFGDPPRVDSATGLPQKGPWIYRPKHGPIVEATIKNSGQTPAYDMVCAGNLVLREYPPGIGPFPHEAIRPPTSKSTLPANGVATQTATMKRPLKKEEFEGLVSGKYAIYYCGTIFYKDVFKENRRTRFRHFYNYSVVSAGIPDRFTSCEEGNEAD